MNLKRERVEWIDIARGFAILMVIVGHSFQENTFPMYSFACKFIYTFHMPIFFIVNGYFFREKKVRDVVKKGFRTLIVPYLFSTVLIGIGFWLSHFSHLSGVFANNFGEPVKFFEAVIYGFGGGPFGLVNPFGWKIEIIGLLWFLLALFWAELIFQLFYKMSRKTVNPEVILVTLSVISALSAIYLARVWVLPFSLNSGMLAVLFIYIGRMFKRVDIVDHIGLLEFTLLLAIWIFAARRGLFQMSAVTETPNLDFFTAIVGAIAGCICVFTFSRFMVRFRAIANPLALLGRRSLIMMCGHALDLGMIAFGMEISNFLSSKNRVTIFIVMTLYRMLIPIFLTKSIPFLPGLRSIYVPSRRKAENKAK